MLKRRRLHLTLFALITGMGAFIRSKVEPDKATTPIAGDIIFSRGAQKYLDEYGYDYPYGNVRQWSLKDDLAIANPECPITENENIANKVRRFLFRADRENAVSLKQAGFDCINLANSHSMDYMSAGLRDIMKYPDDSDLAYVEASENVSLKQPCIPEKNGIRVGVLACSVLPPEGFFFYEEKPTVQYISTVDFSGLEEDIAVIQCDFLIMYFHWGIEYQRHKSDMQERIAKKATDFGADFVVGVYPHVLQEPEIYKDRYIYYSLGDFVFDRQVPSGIDETTASQITAGCQGLTGVEEIPLVIREGKPIFGLQRTQTIDRPAASLYRYFYIIIRYIKQMEKWIMDAGESFSKLFKNPVNTVTIVLTVVIIIELIKYFSNRKQTNDLNGGICTTVGGADLCRF